MPYTPLHVHTEHSSLDGLARLKDTAQAAADHGFEACALTDHGTPGGLWTFAQECKKRGVKPIAGCEVYMAIGSRHDPETMNVYADDGMGDADDEISTDGTRRVKKKSYYHLTVLARNRTGWHNLMRFHNESQQTKIGKHPAGDWQLLKQYGEGLIVLTGCLASPVAGPLAQIQFCDDPDGTDAQALRADAHTAVDHMIAAVGAQHVFVEVMDHGIASEHYVIDELQALAQQRGLDVVATNDSHYLHCDDDRAHEAFLAVGTGSSVRDESRFRFNGSGYHFKTEREMRDIRADDEDWQNAVTATGQVADLVEDDTVPEPEIRLPKFELPDKWETSDAYLRHLVEDGALWRYGEDWQDDDEVVERIDHELSVVADMGYSDYFLITWDIIEYARSQQITTGPGRGCLRGDQKVWTTEGYKQIRDVRIGDTVRTHTGALRKVSNTFRHEVDSEQLIGVKGYSGGDGVTMTRDHKVLVRRAEEAHSQRAKNGARYAPEITSKIEWVEAGDIKKGDVLCIPRPRGGHSAPESFDLAQLVPTEDRGRSTIQITETEIVERVPTNQPFPHSVREVAKSSGIARNIVAGVSRRGGHFNGARPTIKTHRNIRSEAVRDRVFAELRSRGFSNRAQYAQHLQSTKGKRGAKHLSAHILSSCKINTAQLHQVLHIHPESGPIYTTRGVSSATDNNWSKLADELSSRGFSSFSEWAEYLQASALQVTRIPRFIPADEDLAFLIGAFASNGWLIHDQDRVVGFAEQRSKQTQDISQRVKRLFGMDCTYQEHKKSDLIQTFVRSRAVRSLFRHIMADYKLVAQTKHLPDWILDSCESVRRAALEGLWWGDGSRNGERASYSTSSPRLMAQVRDLLWSIGAPAGVQEDNRADHREEFQNRSESWAVRTTPGFTAPKTQFGGADEHYVYSRVYSVEEATRENEVFDLEVPVDHSFMTDSYVVHNSAAGSILAYSLGITGLCPLRYDLLFERFLERGRVGLPDIDMDFPKHQRHLIHAYCQRRYGAGHVAHIGGFNKAQTKAAIKDAARVMTPVLDKTATGRQRDDQELERKEVFKLGDRLAKIIEHGDNSSQPFARLDDPAEEEERLRAEEFWSAVEDGGDTAAEIIELARRFEGVSKNETIHPCGFVISSEPLFDLVPLRPVSKDAGEDEPQVIVWDGDMVEDFGLLKMDFLGIQNLDYIDLTFEYLARRAEEGLPQSVDDIPDPDGDFDGHFGEDVDAAYDMLAAGRTAGVFQLDGAGMTRVVQDIGPENLNDLSAAVALYRPGPISAKMPEDYAAKKHGRQPESYERLTTDEDEIEWLADVLDETYQSVVYQEQGMRLGQVVAGFDDIQRSTLRKAIGKKKQDLMDQCSEWWFDGYDKEFEKNGELISPVFSRQTAERVWGFIKGSADYSFNKCLTSETKLSTERREDYWTIEKLYRRLHGDWSGPADKCPYCWERPAKPQTPDSPCDRCSSWLTKFKDSSRGFRLLAADSTDGRIRPQMVKDVHHNGVREVYKITLADGRTVRATQNHRFLSADGSYIHVRDMAPGETALATHGGDAKNGPRRRWEKGHLVTEATVVSVEPDGVEDVYDVEMASRTDHNFLANGVVSHNSHSAAYALLAYWTAYLKANYPVEYGAAMLATSDNDEKRLMLLADLKGEGIEIGAPAVNESAQKTVPVSGEIRLGLGEIKDVGKAAASIVDARATGGEFAGLHDFATRVKGINVKSMRALIESGAMDTFGPRRGLLKTLYAAKKADVAPVGDDFGVVERDRRQRAVLGTVVGSTTLDHIDLAEVGQSLGVEDEDQSLSVERLGDLRPESRSACHLGVLSEFRSLISKSGRMSKLAIEDTTATPVVVFPQAHRQMMTEFGEPAVGDLVVVAGKVQTSTYASADEAESHQEILANRVWVIDDPTVVHDQPVETSDLVDALEDAHQGMNQETGPAVEEEPAPNAAHQSDNGVHSEDVDSEYDVGEDDGDDSAAAGPQTWMLALVNESLPDGFSPVARGVLYLQGAPREVTGVVVSATEPVYVDRRSGVAVKFVETDDWEGELSQLRAAAGV